jgi:hypothetical protein
VRNSEVASHTAFVPTPARVSGLYIVRGLTEVHDRVVQVEHRPAGRSHDVQATGDRRIRRDRSFDSEVTPVVRLPWPGL